MSSTVSQENETDAQRQTPAAPVNPFLNHQYPNESLLRAVNGLLKQIDDGMYGPTFQIGDHESLFLVCVRQAAERENYLCNLREEADAARLNQIEAEINAANAGMEVGF